ncbi:calcium-binding protein [Streptomyces agglomeratus]|uniref:Calcium-binding protein n=1 Tax=Streptomyces agglomeratus TaxID=285458 RepID=A0A1E5PA43_9ACTN|nr:calcium-binding protein [Streptomyces agglomeratus]OEJ26337.1 calcium-binding protein [Streptomyces agglomeratus]OEJ52167.1 calcium-binding protein [Streptomyces agglomeratus]
MRIRATVAAVSGALALSALAVPAAHADGGHGDTAITKVVVNGGKNVVVGTTQVRTFTVAVTAADDSGIVGADLTLNGPGFGSLEPTDVDCLGNTCTGAFSADPRVDLAYSNEKAGTWYVDAWVDAADGDYVWKQKSASFKLQRQSTVSVNASPEPVVKGRTITITGKLARANWETYTYAGYTNQPVKLQFRKAGTTTYTTVKTVTSNGTGQLKATATAVSDGYWRYAFAGTTTTPAATATGDYVDVR